MFRIGGTWKLEVLKRHVQFYLELRLDEIVYRVNQLFRGETRQRLI